MNDEKSKLGNIIASDCPQLVFIKLFIFADPVPAYSTATESRSHVIPLSELSIVIPLGGNTDVSKPSKNGKGGRATPFWSATA